MQIQSIHHELQINWKPNGIRYTMRYQPKFYSRKWTLKMRNDGKKGKHERVQAHLKVCTQRSVDAEKDCCGKDSPNGPHEDVTNGSNDLRKNQFHMTCVHTLDRRSTYRSRNDTCWDAVLQEVDVGEIQLTHIVFLCRTVIATIHSTVSI